ncbi:hypothetical protein [Planctomyces sp. SH-PL62]|nr:hypothetical protein [Planctomyces sp. SH-PL62]
MTAENVRRTFDNGGVKSYFVGMSSAFDVLDRRLGANSDSRDIHP